MFLNCMMLGNTIRLIHTPLDIQGFTPMTYIIIIYDISAYRRRRRDNP